MTKPGKDNHLRDDAGVIVTLRHREDGALLTRTKGGLVRQALAAALEPYDPAEWQVVAICTPRTILQDLRGRAKTLRQQVTRDRQFGGSSASNFPSPEAVLLAQIDRKEYL